jgi:hypothetical protein
MVWIFTRVGVVRSALWAFVAACALAAPSVVLAADPPVVTRAPDITGTPVVGATLHAVDGAFTGSADAASGFTWLRCPDEDFEDCVTIARATGDSYELTDADAGNAIRVTMWATEGDESSYKVSDPTAVVKTAGGATPPANPPGGPSFDITPTPTKPGPALPAGAKRLKPKPVVRITGRYTSTGARITRFTVKAPVGATTTVACSKGTCPVKKQTIKGGHTSHLAKFERTLKAGTRLQLTIARKGYVSEITILTIRRGKAPSRADSCLVPGRTKRQKCPA